MRFLIIIIFCFITLDSFSNDSIPYPNRIRIDYYYHWSFGKQGNFYTREQFDLVCNNGQFLLVDMNKKLMELKGDSTIKHYENKVYNTKISNNLIKRLLFEFSTNHIPLIIDSTDKADFLGKITLRKLKKIAKQNDENYYFEDNDKEENDSILKFAKSFAILDTFINRQINYDYQDIIIVDYCNHVDFTFYYNNDSVKYDSEVSNFLSQPFIKRDKSNRTNFYNFGINKALIAVLPKESLLREKLQLNQQLDKYIKWYIEK